jgi:predicted permease
MMLLHRLASIAGRLVRRRQADEQLDEEIRAFVEMSAADKTRDGFPPGEARRQAVLELGGVEQAKERVRSGRHGASVDDIGRDVTYACRMFVRHPGFTAAVVVTLALGIGANTAVFSLIDALMLRSLPVGDPQELVHLRRAGGGPIGDAFSYAIVRAFDERREIFSSVAGFFNVSFEVGAGDSVGRVGGAVVTGGFYETLRLRPALGRLLAAGDDEQGAPPVAVISHGYWERRFAGGADAVGQTLRINAHPVTIVGVSPPGFVGANVGSIADITIPVAALAQVNPTMAPLLGPGNFWLRILARPGAGVPVTEATARLNSAWPRIAETVLPAQWPAARRQQMAAETFELNPGATGYSFLRELYRRPLFVLMAVVGVLLIIAAANVASLQLARATVRQREIAVRLAIGAGRGRIVRQLLIESTLLSLVGAAVGVVLAWTSSRFLVDLISSGPVPVEFDLTPNLNVLAFATAVAVATAVLFGVAPAWQTASPRLAHALRRDARTAGSPSRLLPTLVSAQVALSLVLLAGAGLFVRTLQNLEAVDAGFDPNGVLLIDLEGRRAAAPRTLLDEVRRMPGVRSASLSTHTPLSGALWSDAAVPAGQQVPEGDNAVFVGAGPGFFATMDVRLLSGRDFTERDAGGSSGVAIVNEVYAQRHFPGQDPVGRLLSARVRGLRQDLQIVGLARNTTAVGLRRPSPATVYVSYLQLAGDLPTTLAVRIDGPRASLTAAIERWVRAQIPGAAIEVRPMSAQVEATIVQERMMATLAAAFGLLALTLSCVGLYGLLAYGIAQRTKEIGIRVALGARASGIVSLVVKDGARPVLLGMLAGLPVAWTAARGIESMLFGLTATDPATLAGATLVLMAAAQLAGYLPARRAARVNPLVALRHE